MLELIKQKKSYGVLRINNSILLFYFITLSLGAKYELWWFETGLYDILNFTPPLTLVHFP